MLWKYHSFHIHNVYSFPSFFWTHSLGLCLCTLLMFVFLLSFTDVSINRYCFKGRVELETEWKCFSSFHSERFDSRFCFVYASTGASHLFYSSSSALRKRCVISFGKVSCNMTKILPQPKSATPPTLSKKRLTTLTNFP